MVKYSEIPEIVLGGTPELNIPELAVSYTRKKQKGFGKINSAIEAANIIKEIFPVGEIELQEQFIVLYLNQANEVIGYYRHSKGAINATVADPRIILAAALKSLCVSMIIAHNHPSGNLKPSRADEEMTLKIKEASKFMDIRLLDHVIVTKEGYYSFADEGLLGLDGVKQKDKLKEFVDEVENDLRIKKPNNKRSIEKLAL